jgi:hypothetical protein
MLCWPNKGGKPLQLGPEGVESGDDDKPGLKCRNNDKCLNEHDHGPVVPGRYKMNLDTRVTYYDHAAAGQYRLEPWPHHFWHGPFYNWGWMRGGFELHLGSITHGCINAQIKNPKAAEQYQPLKQFLRAEDGNNFLTVIP